MEKFILAFDPEGYLCVSLHLLHPHLPSLTAGDVGYRWKSNP